MGFCSQCGVKLEENATFCVHCGNRVVPQVVYQPVMYQPVMYYPPQMVCQPPPKPKVPGRGFGITSMVLGIVGTVGAINMLFTISMWVDLFWDVGRIILIGMILMYSSMPVLALVFHSSAKQRGYENNISKSGLILGAVGAFLYVINMFVALLV